MITYLIVITFNLYLFKDFFGLNIFSIFFLLFCLSLIYQLIKFDEKKNDLYLRLFKINNLSGLLLFVGIFSLSF